MVTFCSHHNESCLTAVLGTVVTFHHDTSLSLTAPISDRLRQRDTGLRTSSDASMLVQSLLDLGMFIYTEVQT